MAECFGPGFERAADAHAHAAIQGGRMLFLDEVTRFDPAGGRGAAASCAARRAITPDDWFFDGHFKNDPCMPGTLMFEGCLQAMAFYLAALGFTLDATAGASSRCRSTRSSSGAAARSTRARSEVVYEVFVEEVCGRGRTRRVVADSLGTVDGLKAFHARRIGLELVPGWPLDDDARAVRARRSSRTIAVAPTTTASEFD